MASDNPQDQLASIFGLLPKVVAQLPSPVRYRAQNSLEGFSRAKVLLAQDREMASFRAITAAEEAASALIRSIQLRGYPGADLIDLKRHPHKVAVPFFLGAVRQELAGDGPIDMRIALAANPPMLTVALPIRQFVDLPDDLANLHMELADPLGVVGTKFGTEGADFFDQAVQKVAGSRKVDKLIASEANARNHLLYAHDNGLPVSRVTLEGIERHEKRAMLCLVLAVAVLQVDHVQAFAAQCLEGYLKVIKRTSKSQ